MCVSDDRACEPIDLNLYFVCFVVCIFIPIHIVQEHNCKMSLSKTLCSFTTHTVNNIIIPAFTLTIQPILFTSLLSFRFLFIYILRVVRNLTLYSFYFVLFSFTFHSSRPRSRPAADVPPERPPPLQPLPHQLLHARVRRLGRVGGRPLRHRFREQGFFRETAAAPPEPARARAPPLLLHAGRAAAGQRAGLLARRHGGAAVHPRDERVRIRYLTRPHCRV